MGMQHLHKGDPFFRCPPQPCLMASWLRSSGKGQGNKTEAYSDPGNEGHFSQHSKETASCWKKETKEASGPQGTSFQSAESHSSYEVSTPQDHTPDITKEEGNQGQKEINL